MTNRHFLLRYYKDLLLSIIMILICSFSCDDTVVYDCKIRVVNMSDHNIYVCISGCKEGKTSESSNLISPILFTMPPDKHDEWFILRYNNNNNINWKECFGDDIDKIYVAIANNLLDIKQWSETQDPSLLIKLYKYSSEDMGVDKRNFTVYYF